MWVLEDQTWVQRLGIQVSLASHQAEECITVFQRDLTVCFVLFCFLINDLMLAEEFNSLKEIVQPGCPGQPALLLWHGWAFL